MKDINTTNHIITLAKAVEMVKKFMNKKSNLNLQNPQTIPNSESYNIQAISQLINQNNIHGFRIYNGMDEQNLTHSIMVGILQDNTDVILNKINNPQYQPTQCELVLNTGVRNP